MFINYKVKLNDRLVLETIRALYYLTRYGLSTFPFESEFRLGKTNNIYKVNEHWPLMTTVKDNGFSGIQITPRWATRIYYNVGLIMINVMAKLRTLVRYSGLYCPRMD